MIECATRSSCMTFLYLVLHEYALRLTTNSESESEVKPKAIMACNYFGFGSTTQLKTALIYISLTLRWNRN